MGFVDELPVGITFFGRAWSELLLLEIAYSYEQGTKYRKTPKYIVTDWLTICYSKESHKYTFV